LFVICCCLQVLVDGPANLTGVHRQQISLKRLTLTDLKVDVQRQARCVLFSVSILAHAGHIQH
jgi:ribosomal protein L14E/L6E/L27E